MTKDITLEAKWNANTPSKKEDVVSPKNADTLKKEQKVIDTSDSSSVTIYTIITVSMPFVIGTIILLRKKK